MGRIGITYYDVAQAATTIMQQGQQPTIDRIRERLGTGSKTTIATHLKQWKYENEGEIVLTRTSLPPELLSMVQGLWDGMKQTNETKMDNLSTQHQTEKQQLLKTLDELKQQILLQDKELESYQQVHYELTEKQSTLQASHEKQAQQLQQMKAMLAIESAKLQEKEQSIKSQQHQIEQAFTNLEHFRAATQEQRQQEQLQADQQRQELQSQIKLLYVDLHQANKKLSQTAAQCQGLEQRNSFLIEEKQHLEEQQAKRALRHQAALSQQQTLASANLEFKAKNDLLGTRIASLDKELIEKQQQIIALEWELRQVDLQKLSDV